MRHGTLKIMQDAKNNSPMNERKRRDKLTNHLHMISNVWTSDDEIDKASNDLPIACKIR